MSLHREGAVGGVVEGGIYTTLQNFSELKNGQIGFIYTPKVSFSCKLQNVARLIPIIINVHLVGGFQPWPVGYLSPIYHHADSTHALIDAKQATETSHGESSQKRSGQ